METRTYRIAAPMDREPESTKNYGHGASRTVTYEGTTKVVVHTHPSVEENDA